MIRSIGFGGGGMKGILHVGLLLELQKRQPLQFPDGVYGCSIGSIIATFVAFDLPIEGILEFITKHTSLASIVPNLNFKTIPSILVFKGIHSMDTFEKVIIELFESQSLDVKNKLLEDAYMPLFIVSSNITKGIPTIFSGKISVLDAIKASCSIPGFFQPYELHGNLYVDGVHLTQCIASVMPKNSLAVSLSSQRKHKLTPSLIKSMSPLDYVDELMRISSNALHKSQMTKNTVCISYPKLYSNSDLKNFSVSDIIDSAGRQLNTFLATQILR